MSQWLVPACPLSVCQRASSCGEAGPETRLCCAPVCPTIPAAQQLDISEQLQAAVKANEKPQFSTKQNTTKDVQDGEDL